MSPGALPSLLVALALLHPASVLADPKKEGPFVGVRVIVAHAGKEPGRIDPECEEIRTHLGPIDFGSLYVVQKRDLRLRLGQRGALPLPTGTELRIVPLSIIRQRLHLRVEVPGTVNTRLQMSSGRPVILGGPRHRDGHLIVHIVPEY